MIFKKKKKTRADITLSLQLPVYSRGENCRFSSCAGSSSMKTSVDITPAIQIRDEEDYLLFNRVSKK